ncbi:phage tail assembly chaperone [Candidatus Arsenophonus nilaparvatae]|uniref:phage tail assembly chaperone n=1 Tax=Candidatus Arsenophonus nilaparvatae TaxID=1247023 RepID=UPI000509A742|nr:phage tail assembly chaperone [Candidatus Arsenophonus nilaparvatae]
MAKFTLIPKPTFKANVLIPVAGKKEPEVVTFTFNHKAMSELETMREMPIDEFYQQIIADWAIEAPYHADNLKLLFDNYPSAASAISTTYYSELLGQREKNS